MYEAGAWVLLESTLADLPADLRWLFESGAVTIEQLAALHSAFGVTTVADLAAVLREHSPLDLAGFDPAVEAAIAQRCHSCARRFRASRSAAPAPSPNRCSAACAPSPGVDWAEPAGSLRRGQDTVGDIEIVASIADPAEAIEQVARLPDDARWLHRSERRLYFLVDRVQVGVRLPEPANAGATLLYLTGSAEHFSRCRRAPPRRMPAHGRRAVRRRRRAAAGGDRRRDLRRARAAVHSAGDPERRR